jgi:hypothetical protein
MNLPSKIVLGLMVLIPAVLLPACDKDDILGNNEDGSLSGVVFDGSAGNVRLAGVRISLVGRETTTNANGEYAFSDIPVGTHQLSAFKQGYQAYDANVQVKEDDVDDPFANRHSFFMRLE